MTGPVHISSLVVQVRPDRLAAVRRAIEDAGGEIPASDPSGKLVVVLETASEAAVTSFASTVSALDGVLSANLVYHLIDGEEAGSDPADARAAEPQGGIS